MKGTVGVGESDTDVRKTAGRGDAGEGLLMDKLRMQRTGSRL